MAKIIAFILVSVLLVCSSTHCFSQIYSPQRTCLIGVYKSQIGVREATGKNDGTTVEKYLKTVGLGKGYAWCAAFVKWCLLQAQVAEASRINAMALSTHRKDLLVYYQGKMIVAPLPGDVGTLYYASLKRIGHTFFFNGMASAGTIYTVEGNTNSQNSREGDGVYLRIRSLSSVYSLNRWLK